MSTPATRVNGAQITSLVSCPVASGAGGLWWDGNTTGPKWRKADGTDVTLGAGGGGSTGNWTFSTNNADLSGAGTMGIGLTTATAISLGQATSLASGKALSSAGGAANFDWSASSGTFKTSTGAFTFGGTTVNVPAASTIQSTAQGSTNTTGLTLAPNVADGASSIVLALKNTTATTSAKLMSFQTSTGSVSGQVELDTIVAGSFVVRQPSTTYMGFFDSGNNGFKIQSGITYFRALGSDFVSADGSSLSPVNDSANTLGTASLRWLGVYASAFNTKSQANTVGATFTINPASGSFVKQTLTSATNVTAVTISAGIDGQELVVEIIQPGTGTAATMVTTWTNVSFAGGAGSFTATLGKRDMYSFMYDGATSKWYEIGRALNLAN